MHPLQLKRVVKKYGDKRAVNEVTLDVAEGEIYGLLGANGAGKTTTMRMVLGLLCPDEGEILYNGHPFNKKVQQRIGYLPEERGLYPKITVKDQMIYLARLRGMSYKDADQNVKYWLDHFQTSEYYNQKVEQLSKGNQQKMGFIAAIVHRPQILILDEAFSGLDPINVELLKLTVKELQRQGTSILFSTHRMEHVEELCENITILDRSNTVVQGNIQQIKQKYAREKVILRTTEMIDVQQLLQIEGVKKVDFKAQQGYVVHINHVDVAQTLLKVVMETTAVDHFEIKQPSLNEIFLLEVGDRNE